MSEEPACAFGVPVPYTASLPELREQLAAPGPKAWAACLALGRRSDPESLALLVEAAARGWDYRNLAIQSLGRHPLGAGAADVVLAGLGDPVSQVVRTSCDAASRLGLTAARGKLRELVRSADAQIRFHALRALGAVWTEEDYAQVWTLFKKDPEIFVRQEAAAVLKAAASVQNWRRLFDHWKHSPLPQYRLWACGLLAEFGQPGDMSELQRLVRDGNIHVRRAAQKLSDKRGREK
ncbi:MAG: HEAT repeat domain-containing protein [Elusimicrobiota bacterium]|jgi:HEAT repeat protein